MVIKSHVPAPYLNTDDHHPVIEATPLALGVQRMMEAHNHVIQLFLEAQHPAHTWGAPPPQHLPTEGGTHAPQHSPLHGHPQNGEHQMLYLTPLGERVQRIEESHNEILHLLQKALPHAAARGALPPAEIIPPHAPQSPPKGTRDEKRPPLQEGSSKRRGNFKYTAPSIQHNKFKPQPPKPCRQYTSLRTSRADILMAIKDKDTLRWPKPLKNPNKGDQSQYCHFHRSLGHRTGACFLLKEEIERLIKQGYLGQFIQGRVLRNEDTAPTNGQQAQKPQQQENRQFVGEICTIAARPPTIH